MRFMRLASFPKNRPEWLNWRNGIFLGVGLVGLGIAIALATGQLKAGIGGGKTEVTSVKTTVGGVETTTTTTPQEAKTLWDWLSLAGVPLSLAGLGFWLQLQQQKQNDLQKERELEQTKQLAAIEQDIAEQNRQEEALQNYFDKVSALLEKGLTEIAAKGDAAMPEEINLLNTWKKILRARTLSILLRLDSDHNRTLTMFLFEADIIPKLVTFNHANLRGANLRDAILYESNFNYANLSGADLYSVRLSRAKMQGANLSGATLRHADLSGVKLMEADLNGADLSKANLCFVNLSRADLSNADLSKANLSQANLSGADLSKAGLYFAIMLNVDLRGAKGLNEEQLENENPPYLCRTQLPEGMDIDPNRDCDRLKRMHPSYAIVLQDWDASTKNYANLEGSDLTNANLPD